VFSHQPLRSAVDQYVEIGLNLQEHSHGDAPLERRFQGSEQETVPLSFGHIDRAFAANILKRPPRSGFNQALHDFDGRTGMGCLM